MSRLLSDLEPEVARLAERLITACADRGIFIIPVQTLRSFEEQDALYAQGRTDPGKIVTKAKGGESWHNFGRAFDVAFHPPETPKKISWEGPWEMIGGLGEEIGLIWGGRWKFQDKPHFEYHPNLTLAQAREKTK